MIKKMEFGRRNLPCRLNNPEVESEESEKKLKNKLK